MPVYVRLIALREADDTQHAMIVSLEFHRNSTAPGVGPAIIVATSCNLGTGAPGGTAQGAEPNCGGCIPIRRRPSVTFRNRSASGRCAGFALAGLLVLPAQGRAATASETLDSCAERITRSPYDYDAHVCVFRVAQSGDARAEAEAYLERLGTPLADVVRGFIIQARDETLAASLYVRGADGLERARKSSGGETTEGEIAARSNLATILKRRGDVAGARRQVEIAAEATRTNSSPKVRGRALLLEANFLVDTGGDLARVEANLLEAEPLFFPGGAYTQRRALVRDRANLRFSQGRFEAAAQDYRRMLAMASAENDLVGSMVATFNLAFTLWTLAEEHPTTERSGIASAAILARQARDQANAASDSLFAHRAIELEAHIARAQKRSSEARDLYVDALARARQLGHPEKIATSALALADLRAAEHSPGGPIAPDLARALAEADVAFEAVSNPRYRTSLWPWRLHTLWRVDPEALAIPQSSAALDSIETLRIAQSDESNRIAVQSTWARDYRWVAGRLLERFATRSEEAFAAMERLRARALRESLTASRIGAIETVADVPVATLAEARAALTPDELLVSFQIDDDRDVFGESAGGSWALALTRDKARAFRLADRAELEAFTAGLLAVLELPELVGPVAQRLGLSLFGAPLADVGPGIRRLLIVPDGVLHQIPFEALALGADGGESLGLRFEIAVLPSASYLVEARRSSTPPHGAGALLVADPGPVIGRERGLRNRQNRRARAPALRTSRSALDRSSLRPGQSDPRRGRGDRDRVHRCTVSKQRRRCAGPSGHSRDRRTRRPGSLRGSPGDGFSRRRPPRARRDRAPRPARSPGRPLCLPQRGRRRGGRRRPAFACPRLPEGGRERRRRLPLAAPRRRGGSVLRGLP